VLLRLRHVVSQAEPGTQSAADLRLRSEVLDCVVALEQLHRCLAHGASRRRQLE
jgi:hypothetical protein